MLWFLLFLAPLFGILYLGGTFKDGLLVVFNMTPNYVMWIGAFYLNYVYFVPQFYLRKRFFVYVLLVVATYLVLGQVNSTLYYLIHGEPWKGTGNVYVDMTITSIQILLTALLCLAAIAFRVTQHNKQLISQLLEEKEKSQAIADGSKQEDAEQSQPTSPQQDATFMFVKCEAKQVRVNFDDILFINAMKDYVRIYLTSSSRPLIALSTMKAIEEKLPNEKFCRVHRSYIVSLDKIESIERNRIKIAAELIPVGDSYQEAFHQRLS